jgi:diguanylate cyclase (GGDEF)-like protein/PAS domain S-box-containing protein
MHAHNPDVTLIGRLALLGLSLFLASAASAAGREVRVGVYENPPKLTAGAQGQPSGIFGDILQAVAAAEGWTLKAVPCTWEACLAGLDDGTIDLMPDVAFSESRAQTFDFHQVAALHSWSQLYRRKDVEIRSILDLERKRVAVLEGSVQQQNLQGLVNGFGIAAEFVPVRSFDEGFARVASGAADVVAANYHFGSAAAVHHRLLPTDIVFLPAKLFFATDKGRNADLLAAMDRHLQAWQSQPGSPYFQALGRWGVAPAKPLVPPVVWWSLAGAVGLLLLSLGIVALLRREVRRQTHELRASEEKLATILNSVDAYIYIKDTGLRYQYANRKLCELFGKPLEEVIGQRAEAFFEPATALRLAATDHAVIDSAERQVAEEVVSLSGKPGTRTFLSVKLPLYSPSREIVALCGIATDITDQRQFIQEIHQLAFYDPLTRLANRRQMTERLDEFLSDGSEAKGSHALLLINLDRFKDVNDTQGYKTGDELLCQVAQRLNAFARKDDLVARLGSDEFAMLLGAQGPHLGTARQQVEQIARRLMQTLTEAPYRLGPQDSPVAACIGIVMLTDGRASAEDVLKRADLALMQAKAAGRNATRFFQPDMEAVATARAALEADLREGLAQDQFLLHYQPQFDVQGRLFGVEALVRWQHPARGLVMPAGFIGLAEASGLIEPLGRQILRIACRQIAEWSRSPATEPLLVSVNVSSRQLHQPDFVAQVFGILAEAGANPQRLELELTESHLVEDVEGAMTKMHALKAGGVRLSLDDFGTGYSSLNYLKRLPIDQLKIDQSFVRDLLFDPNDLSLVKAIVEMGRSLNLMVVAEGVETLAQRDTLAAVGCLHYQGYFFSRPVPVNELQRWLQPVDSVVS